MSFAVAHGLPLSTFVLEVLAWRGAEMLLEHRNERAGAVVPGLDRSGCYFVTGSENLKRVHQSQLASPFIES